MCIVFREIVEDELHMYLNNNNMCNAFIIKLEHHVEISTSHSLNRRWQ